MIAGLSIFAKEVGVMAANDPDATPIHDPAKVREALESDRSHSALDEPKFLWEEGEYLEAQGLSYKIKRNLATGGFGNTYKAWDNKKKKWVVLKMPTSKIWKDLGSEACQKIFREEGDRLGGFRFSGNPHLVICETHFSLPDGLPVIVMEYVEGENLWDRIRSQGPIPEQLALNYIDQLSQAVRALHQAKPPLFHRDIKPANIILKKEQNREILVLVDFGISREAGSQETVSGSRTDQLAWAPEEQVNRYCPVQPCHSHDVHAIAKTLYWLMTRQELDLDPQPSTEIVSQQTYDAIKFVTETESVTRVVTIAGSQRQEQVSELKNRLTLDDFLSRLPSKKVEVQKVEKTPEKQLPPAPPTATSLVYPDSAETLPSQPIVPDDPLSEPQPRSGLLKAIVLRMLVSPALAICIISGLGWFAPLLGPPVPVEEKTYSTFNDSTFNLSYKPDLWEDKTQGLDPFRDRIVTYLVNPVDESLVISIEQYPNSYNFSLPKSAKDEKNGTITLFGQSLKTVTYFDSDRSLQVQQITLPLDQKTYLLFYEADPKIFPKYREEALNVFASFHSTP